jgi:hypothetical protein
MHDITGEAYFNNGITVAGGGNEVLFGLLSDVANQKDIMRDFEENMNRMGYVNQIAQSKDERFTQIAPTEEMDDLVEDGVKPELESEKMPNK